MNKKEAIGIEKDQETDCKATEIDCTTKETKRTGKEIK